jgi:hypothetical protein
METLKAIYARKPLTVIVIAGFLFRLIAAIFSKGYGMHDDHFLVIEAGQSIADGFDYNNWLPWNSGGVPSGHSWFYVGFHFLLFKIFHWMGIADPQIKMLLIRFIHAVYSLLVIVLGYKITLRLSNEEIAKKAAWILALLWFIPAMSVRNMVEWVCVPPLLASSLALIKFDESKARKYVLLAGFWAGIAMGIRYQCLFFFAGVGLFMLWRKEILNGIFCLIAFFLAFFITQANDLFLWGKPFVELTEYVNYNFANATTYFNQPSYQYLITLGGMLIPPVSLFLFAGFFKSWKKVLPILLPSLCFFVAHSFFPNKQERFILPFAPYLIMAGMIGWEEIRTTIKWKKFERGSWKFFWILNTLALLVFSTMYSKRSKVEAMYYLYQQPDYNNYLVETSHLDSDQTMPQFYSGKWQKSFRVCADVSVESFASSARDLPADMFPRYILFFEAQDIEKRVSKFETATGKTLKLVFDAEPSNMDYLLHWLNKHNRNQPVFIYRVN